VAAAVAAALALDGHPPTSFGGPGAHHHLQTYHNNSQITTVNSPPM